MRQHHTSSPVGFQDSTAYSNRMGKYRRAITITIVTAVETDKWIRRKRGAK